jgi:DNA-binding transcriptional regulator YiaG
MWGDYRRYTLGVWSRLPRIGTGWDDAALATRRRPGHNDECGIAMASAQVSGIRPPRNPTSTERPRDGARLERLAETQRLLETLRRLGYGPSWVAERLGVHPASVTNWSRGRRVPRPETLAKLRAVVRRVLRIV